MVYLASFTIHQTPLDFCVQVSLHVTQLLGDLTTPPTPGTSHVMFPHPISTPGHKSLNCLCFHFCLGFQEVLIQV